MIHVSNVICTSCICYGGIVRVWFYFIFSWNMSAGETYSSQRGVRSDSGPSQNTMIVC